VSQLLLSELTPLVGAQHGTFYIAGSAKSKTVLKLLAGYAIDDRDGNSHAI
jgi:kynureninase